MRFSVLIAGAFAISAFAVAPAEASHHKRALPPSPASFCNPADIMRPCSPLDFLFGVRSIKVDMRRESRRDRIRRIAETGAGRVAGIAAPLAAKVAEIQSSCGSVVISGVRHTRIAGTRRISLHASGKAVDMRGNPSCIYARLVGWPGGYSRDYGRVRHVHISYDVEGGREMGLRFAHGGHKKRHRYARHRQPHHANALLN